MKLLQGNRRGNDFCGDDEEAKRKRLLQLVHVAKKDMKWGEEYYRSLLESCFGVSTAAALSLPQLEALIAAIRNRGWKPMQKPGEIDEQILAFRARIRSLAERMPNGEERVRGVCREMCDVESLDWCKDGSKLRRILAIVGNIYRREAAIGGIADGAGR